MTCPVCSAEQVKIAKLADSAFYICKECSFGYPMDEQDKQSIRFAALYNKYRREKNA